MFGGGPNDPTADVQVPNQAVTDEHLLDNFRVDRSTRVEFVPAQNQFTNPELFDVPPAVRSPNRRPGGEARLAFVFFSIDQ